MKNFLNLFYRNSTTIYKVLILASTLILIVYFFSQNGRFQYDFSPNKIWAYNDLTAPFDFTLRKTDEALQREEDSIEKNTPVFLQKIEINIDSVVHKVNKSLWQRALSSEEFNELKNANRILIPKIYRQGYIQNLPSNLTKLSIIDKHRLIETGVDKIFTSRKIDRLIERYFKDKPAMAAVLKKNYKENLSPNLFVNQGFRQSVVQQKISDISLNKGLIRKGQVIIKKGQRISPQKYEVLLSLKQASMGYANHTIKNYWIFLGYAILVSMVLFMLLFFLKKYRPEIYDNNLKISLILFNMLLVVVLTSLTIRHYPGYVFIVPLIILPLILKAFFDARVALFVHILTILLLGFIVANSFEFIYLQIMAGIASILTVSELTKRSNLFTSVGGIVLIYIIGYLAFHLIYEGNLSAINYNILLQFFLNGLLAIALSHQLILLYEKLFGLVSDVSLLEWSNTNTKLLKRLADKAPGTFNHSMQVANLAEAAANAINANSLLVRAGALYHDIGKMLNPFYFTENQTSGVNYHDDLAPEESAKIIIRHVLDGIELARKNNLPDRLIDFIRTHHGEGLVQYFYKKALEKNPEINPDKFRYPGPNPFSKETAILMMADSVEAASKSLREPTAEKIDEFVDKIINHQLYSGLLDNANITLKEISIIKKLFKKKLKNIYHLRIEYPE